MAEYAVMPYTDYKDACDAVREKTGGTDAIVSGDLGTRIRAIDTQEDLSEELTEQDSLIADIMTALEEKTAGIEVVVTGTGDATNCYLSIDGVVYTSAVNTKVKSGDTIVFCVGTTWAHSGILTINGTTVAESSSSTAPKEYSWEVPENISNVAITLDYSNSCGLIDVTTTEAETNTDFTPTDSGGTTYKSKFGDNNVDLQTVLDMVNGLEVSDTGAGSAPNGAYFTLSDTDSITLTLPEDTYGYLLSCNAFMFYCIEYTNVPFISSGMASLDGSIDHAYSVASGGVASINKGLFGSVSVASDGDGNLTLNIPVSASWSGYFSGTYYLVGLNI